MTVTATSSTCDQVFEPDLAGVLDDLGAALVAEVLLDFLQFLDDQVAQHLVRTQDLQVLGDAALDVGQLVQDLLLLHAGEALELQFDDGLGLLLAELEARRSDDFAAPSPRQSSAARIELRITSSRWSSAFWKPSRMCSRSRALRSSYSVRRRTTSMRWSMKHLMQSIRPELAGLAVDDRQHDDAEADLQLRVLVQVVEHDLGLFAALQFEHDAHAVAVALVADVADAFDLLLVDQRGVCFDQPRLVDLVRDLGDDDLLRGPCRSCSMAALARSSTGRGPRGVGVENALPAQDEAAGREIGTLARSP